MKLIFIVLVSCFVVFLQAQDLSDVPYVQKKVSDSFFVEHAADVFVQEMLDGPAREAMVRNVWSVDCDTAGNLYLYDATTCNVRAIRRSDKRMFTLSGNGHVSFGGPLTTGPAHRLYLGSVAMIALPRLHAIGDPMTGNGSLYVWDSEGEVLVRLYRNPDQGGTWWYEHIAGGGSVSPADGVVARSISLYNGGAQAMSDGRVIVMRSGQFFLVQSDGTLKSLVRQSLLDSINPTANNRRSYGINGAGVFCITSGSGYVSDAMWFISPDGDSLLQGINQVFALEWGVYPDRVRNRWYTRGMDDYSINRYEVPGPNRYTMMSNGLWEMSNAKNPSTMYGGERGMPMMDGRYATWSGHSGSPVFINHFLDEVGRAALIHSQDQNAGVAVTNVIPSSLGLGLSGTPNPFTEASLLEFSVPNSGTTSLQVFSVTGRLVRTLFDGVAPAGFHRLPLLNRDFAGHPAGIYFIRLTQGSQSAVLRLVKVR